MGQVVGREKAAPYATFHFLTIVLGDSVSLLTFSSSHICVNASSVAALDPPTRSRDNTISSLIVKVSWTNSFPVKASSHETILSKASDIFPYASKLHARATISPQSRTVRL